MLFKLNNNRAHRVTHCGVLEFVADEGRVYLPYWVIMGAFLQTTAEQPFSGTTRVSQYQKGKTSLDFTEARDNEWQWHQLGHMQVCTSLRTDYHASTPLLVFYRPGALSDARPTVSKH